MQFSSNIQFLLVILSSQLFHTFQTFQSLPDIIQLSSSPKRTKNLVEIILFLLVTALRSYSVSGYLDS